MLRRAEEDESTRSPAVEESQQERATYAILRTYMRSARTDDYVSTGPLFDLPGEVRNYIVRLALVEDKCIETTIATSTPGILRCCRQLRHEGLPIYLTENTFYMRINDSMIGNPHWLLKYPNTIHNMAMSIHQLRSWTKLKTWLRLYHDSSVMRMPKYDGSQCKRQKALASSLFDVVKELKGVPWETVEKTLESVRAAFHLEGRYRVFSSDS